MSDIDQQSRGDTCPDCLGEGFSLEPGAGHLEPCATCESRGWIPAAPISDADSNWPRND